MNLLIAFGNLVYFDFKRYTSSSASKKMTAFKIIKNKTSKVTRRLSLILSLVTTPKNMSRAKPPKEINKMGLYYIPTRNRMAPIPSSKITRRPIFSN